MKASVKPFTPKQLIARIAEAAIPSEPPVPEWPLDSDDADLFADLVREIWRPSECGPKGALDADQRAALEEQLQRDLGPRWPDVFPLLESRDRESIAREEAAYLVGVAIGRRLASKGGAQ